MLRQFGGVAAAALLIASGTGLVPAQAAPRPATASANSQVSRLISQLTLDEKLSLVFGYFGEVAGDKHPPAQARPGSAGYVPGVPRLGIPAQWQTDAGIGVATQHDAKQYRERTALPSGLATTATWDKSLAYQGGRMIGAEARASGFNVMLAGGVNLAREPRNGRNFEYGGEDPLLAGTLVGAQVAGIQSNAIISTIKHYAVNDQENGRSWLSSQIDHDQARMSDLLAFEIAIEKGRPGSIMCAYNRVNQDYACENDWLLNQVLKGDWGYKGYVMSDWGAVHSTTKAALAGLDQESAGEVFDKAPYFAAPLKAAILKGEVPMARLDDMVRRVLGAMVETGLLARPVTESPIDYTADGLISRTDAENGMVLLKNDHDLLPLAKSARRIAVIGGHADVGVLSGGGSSQVYPVGGMAVPNEGPTSFPGPIVYYPSSPLKALAARLPGAQLRYADGSDPAAAAKLAADSDMVIVFATQWTAEAFDASLSLNKGQDELIAAVAGANPKTVVVLETGGPVLMPWLDKAGAVLEAWYPGTSGGEAIARVLTGEVDAGGRLPLTFPASLDQLPRPRLDGDPSKPELMFDVTYSEGAAVGYKWYDLKGLKPLFAFGHGLSYTRFRYDHLTAHRQKGQVRVSFRVTNTGHRDGRATPQLYVSPVSGGWEAPKRLAGWDKLTLKPGQTRQVSLTLDPRILASFKGGWRIAPGDYQLMLGGASDQIVDRTTVTLAAKRWSGAHR